MWTPGPPRDPDADPTDPPGTAPGIEPEPGYGGEPEIDYPGVEPGRPGAEPGVEPTEPTEQ
jgi:hypothetical protein